MFDNNNTLQEKTHLLSLLCKNSHRYYFTKFHVDIPRVSSLRKFEKKRTKNIKKKKRKNVDINYKNSSSKILQSKIHNSYLHVDVSKYLAHVLF